MYLSTNRDFRQRQAVTNSHFCVRAVHNLHAILQSDRSQDICLLAVCVADQGDVRRSVGIVLDADYGCRHVILISLEIDHSVFSSVSASAMSHGDLTLVVTSGVLLQGNAQALLRSRLRDLSEIGASHVSSGRCIWVVSLNSHDVFSFSLSFIVVLDLHLIGKPEPLNRPVCFLLMKMSGAMPCPSSYPFQVRLTALRKSRFPCCQRSGPRLPSWSSQSFQPPCRVFCSCLRSSSYLRS